MMLSVTPAAAQNTVQPDADAILRQTILDHDATFWVAFNACDLETIESYFTEDLEFYHDRIGLTESRNSLLESVRNGRCDGIGPSLRREAVADSIRVYPLNNYGAIITGRHIFHITEEGSPERPDSIARFTHVWKFADDEWRMSRVLSYDHRPAPVVVPDEAKDVTAETLARYAGEYETSQGGVITVTAQPNTLHVRFGQFSETIRPSSQTQFFHPQRPLTFEFALSDDDRVESLLVKENGNTVETAPKRANKTE